MTLITQYKMRLCILLFSCLVFSACELAPEAQQSHSTKGISHKNTAELNSTAQQRIVKSPNDSREYARVLLDNQLEVVLVSDPSIEKSAAALSVAVGSLQDPKAFPGLAHYLEHMLLLGTEDFPEVGGFAKFIIRHGGTHNAETQLNKTNYMLAVNSDAYDQALARFSGFFYQAKLDKNAAEKERHAVHAEWKMRQANDWVKLEQLNGYTLNPEHPISQFSWGNLSSLTDKGEQKLHLALQQMYQDYYSANLMKATLISPLSIAQMKSLAAEHFGKIPNTQKPKPTLSMPVAKAEQLKKIVHYQAESDLQQLRIEFVLQNQLKQFVYNPNAYVHYLLTNEMPGSLASLLREKGFSESLYATYDVNYYNNAGSFSLYIDLTASGAQNRDQVMAATLKYLTLLQTKGVHKSYFKEIQQSLSNAFRFKEKVNDYNYATHIAAALHEVPAEYVLSSEYELQKYNPEAIQAVLEQLTLDNARVFYIDKNQPTDLTMPYFLGQYKVQDIQPAMLTKWQKLAETLDVRLPRPNTLMPENFDLITPRYTQKPVPIQSTQAYSAYLGHSALFQQPKGITVLEFNTDVHQASAKNQLLSYLFEQGLNQQLTELASEAQAAGMGLHLSVSNGLSITLSGFTDKQPLLLTRVLDELNQFTLQPAQLSNLTAKLTSQLANQSQQNLLQQARQKLEQVFYLKSVDEAQLLINMASITIQDLQQFKQQLISQANLRVLAFGNYTQLNVKSMAELALAKLPVVTSSKSTNPQAYYQSPVVNWPKGAVFSWQQESNLADVALIDLYLLEKTPQNLAAARILDKFIHAAFVQQLRVTEQLAYDLSFDGQVFNNTVLVGFYIQSPVVGLTTLGQRIEQFRQSFSLQLSQVSAEQFADTKQGLISSFTQTAKNLNQEMQSYFDDWQNQNTQFDSKDRLVAALQNTTLEHVIKLYSRLKTGDEFGRVLIQFRGTKFNQEDFITLPKMKVITDIEGFHQSLL